jgi:hypothetical protein
MESPFKISGIRRKTLNLLLVLTSLLGYLEWGTGNKMFLFQGELLIITKLFSNPESVIHPFILLPLFGQVLLIITLFQKQPGKFFNNHWPDFNCTPVGTAIYHWDHEPELQDIAFINSIYGNCGNYNNPIPE